MPLADGKPDDATPTKEPMLEQAGKEVPVCRAGILRVITGIARPLLPGCDSDDKFTKCPR
jgi:hypothetical protein